MDQKKVGRWALDVGRWTFSVRMRSMRFGKIAVILRRNGSSLDFFYVAAIANPFRAQWRQTLRNIAVKIGVAPGTACVVHAHRFVDFDFAVERFSRRERDFAERHSDFTMQFAGDVNFARVRQS